MCWCSSSENPCSMVECVLWSEEKKSILLMVCNVFATFHFEVSEYREENVFKSSLKKCLSHYPRQPI